MERGAWWATVHTMAKSRDTTEACVCASNLRKLIFYYFGVVLLSQLSYYKFFLSFTFKGILSYSSDKESFMLKAISTLFSVSFCFISF